MESPAIVPDSDPAKPRTLAPGFGWRCLVVIGWLLLIGQGCVSSPDPGALPNQAELTVDHLVLHSDFKVSARHRLIDELVARRNDVGNLLAIPLSDEPIHVYLFEDRERFSKFMKKNHPEFPERRAFFVKTDTDLKVYAYWGERVAEDLRHEVTHGYLHSTVPDIPLWMDEGIAEFFETPRGVNGFNQAHVYQLANEFRRGEWSPDLKALEQLSPNDHMSQVEYAESWLWIHYLVHHDSKTREHLRTYLRNMDEAGASNPISQELLAESGEVTDSIIAHLRTLAEKM